MGISWRFSSSFLSRKGILMPAFPMSTLGFFRRPEIIIAVSGGAFTYPVRKIKNNNTTTTLRITANMGTPPIPMPETTPGTIMSNTTFTIPILLSVYYIPQSCFSTLFLLYNGSFPAASRNLIQYAFLPMRKLHVKISVAFFVFVQALRLYHCLQQRLRHPALEQ